MSWIKRPKPIAAPAGGYAVVNGVRLRIAGVVLEHGEILFELRADGPCELEGPITLFGVDHQGVMQGHWVEKREIRAGECCQINMRLRVQHVTEGVPAFQWREGRP